jgi:predicted membrane protein
MGHRDFLMVSTTGRLLGTVLLTVAGQLFRSQRYVAFFTVLGISIAIILLVMVYRSGIERAFRRIRAAQRLRHRAERSHGKD